MQRSYNLNTKNTNHVSVGHRTLLLSRAEALQCFPELLQPGCQWGHTRVHPSRPYTRPQGCSISLAMVDSAHTRLHAYICSKSTWELRMHGSNLKKLENTRYLYQVSLGFINASESFPFNHSNTVAETESVYKQKVKQCSLYVYIAAPLKLTVHLHKQCNFPVYCERLSCCPVLS